MSSYIPIFLLLIIIFITQRNEKAVLKNIINKRKTEDSEMFELAQKFINKECIIYTFNSQIIGTINEVNEGGILIEKSGTLEAVNFDFIVRIREYPKNKNGKKKSVIFD
ncbi:MAG: hypothetical protein IJE01_04900 [Clostridia bacterium]|nr:hypothetical protein [Clostridia bacterium]